MQLLGLLKSYSYVDKMGYPPGSANGDQIQLSSEDLVKKMKDSKVFDKLKVKILQNMQTNVRILLSHQRIPSSTTPPVSTVPPPPLSSLPTGSSHSNSR